jgi:hypothetical protein
MLRNVNPASTKPISSKKLHAFKFLDAEIINNIISRQIAKMNQIQTTNLHSPSSYLPTTDERTTTTTTTTTPNTDTNRRPSPQTMFRTSRFTRCPDPHCKKVPTIANPRVYQTLIASVALALGIWFLVIELHENEQRWRKTAGVAIFYGDLPPVPQYMPGDVPRYAESPIPGGRVGKPTPVDVGMAVPTHQVEVVGHWFVA